MQTIELAGQMLDLHPFRAAYWHQAATLLLADTHLGKSAHFRRAGIAVPRAVADANFERLRSLLVDFRPERVLVLGDLFHSDYNSAWEEFADLIAQFDAVRFELVPGNHDVLGAARYAEAGLHLHPAVLDEGPFRFQHFPPHPEETPPADRYILSGHLHPCVRLRGNGRDGARLPCFYFGGQHGILPAFGAFTGCAEAAVRRGDRVYVVTPTAVVPAMV
jgi:DNA ligase-associated metallophosphoesterase